MKSIRIGNDINIGWSINRNGAPESFEGKHIEVTLTNIREKESIAIQDYKIDDGVINFTFFGKDQTKTGEYLLTLYENKGELGMAAIDACHAFYLVPRTCNISNGEKDPCGLKTETVSLESNIEVPKNGLSAYELAVQQGFKGTLDEWLLSLHLTFDELTPEEIAELQKPANDMISVLEETNIQGQAAKEGAIQAADRANELSNHRDIVKDGYWWRWDENTKVYVKTEWTAEAQYNLTKRKVEEVLTGEITTHNHKGQLTAALVNYVRKVQGKGLSTNDFTDSLKAKLEGLSEYNPEAIEQAIVDINNRIDTLVGGSASEAIDTFREIEAFLQGITDKETLTGILNGLKLEVEGKIPTKVSELANDSNFIDDAPNDGKIYGRRKNEWFEVKGGGGGTGGSYDDTELRGRVEDLEVGKLDISTYDTDKNSFLTKDLASKTYQPIGNYAEKSDIPDISGKLDKSVYDTDKKTFALKSEIPDTSLLATKKELEAKQDVLVSGKNIATINGQDITKGGDITIGGGESGTSNYNELANKPQINSVVLSGNKTAKDLKLQPEGDYALKTDIPTVDVDKSYVDTELGKKVDKVNGKSLVLDTEIARLSKVDNYTLTKSKVEEVLTGDIATHNHAAQLAEALANYVQKVVGKDLSTNDFTTALKEKLEGLENYDDAAIQQAISTINGRIDTLIGTSASEAIDNFNEIEAFLQGITDKQTLTGLLNDLKQEIVALIPTKTSELTNDSNFVVDESYVHTDNNYTTSEKTKLEGIEKGAQVNPESLPANGGNSLTVNGHTVESNVPSDAKFTDTTYVDATTEVSGLMSSTDKTKLDGVESGAQVNIIKSDAPSDTNQYVRQDGAWAKVTIPEGKDEVAIGDTPPAEIPDLFIDTSRNYPIDPKPESKAKPFWVIFDESKSTTVLETGGDANARDEFFKKFKRCLVKPQANGTAAITYLDENDSNNYEDGTPTNFGSGSLGLQMMVHFPKYYFKNEDLGGERFKLWCCEDNYDGTYKEERAALVGVFEAFSDSGKLNSWSGRLSTGDKTITTFYNEAQANGKQWGLIDYRVHKTIANLFCLKYGNTNINTENPLIPCSGGTKPGDSGVTGGTLSLGNKDGLANTSSSFLCVEDCYYSKWELVQGVNVVNRKWIVYDGGLKVDVDEAELESAGFSNIRIAGNGGTTDGWISKINHGEYADVIPMEIGGSGTTYYSDYYYQSSTKPKVIFVRSGRAASTSYCGIFTADAEGLSSYSGLEVGSRLCFYGNIEVKTKDEFISLSPDFNG